MKKRYSSIDDFLDAVPDVNFGMVYEALVDLAEHYFDDERLDYVANANPEHVFIKWIVLLKWMKTMTLDESPLH